MLKKTHYSKIGESTKTDIVGCTQTALAHPHKLSDRGRPIRAEQGIGPIPSITKAVPAHHLHIFGPEIAVPGQRVQFFQSGPLQRFFVTEETLLLIPKRYRTGYDRNPAVPHGHEMANTHL